MANIEKFLPSLLVPPGPAVKGTAALRREERRFRPRLMRAWIRFARRLQAEVDDKELEAALGTGSVRKVMDVYSEELISELLEPFASILRDATIKGGRVGEKEVS